MSSPQADPTASYDGLAALVERLKQEWRNGRPPDAGRAVADYPGLLAHRSLVVDLAYEEYCLREEAGAPPAADDFCRRLPAYQSQIREVLRGHRLLADHPELLRPAAPDWPAAGGTFEGLAVVRELGRGAFARVFLATDPETGGRFVVVKLSAVLSGEARTLGPIHHPHVVEVLWARRAGGFYTVCMPFAAAVTLQDVLAAVPTSDAPRAAQAILDAVARGTVGTDRPGAAPSPLLTGRESYTDGVVRIASRLADALGYLERAGVAHGDVKPSNILVAPGGHPYLIDFNLASGGEHGLDRYGGTLPYMAPERLRLVLGGPGAGASAAQADIYSFGVVLFEALTRTLPIAPADTGDAATAAADLLNRQLAGAGLEAVARSGLPRPLAAVLARCLSPDPDRRPTADELRRGLDAFLTRRRTFRRRLTAIVFGAAVLAGGYAVATAPQQDAAPPDGGVKGALSPDELFARGVGHLKDGAVSAALKDIGDARRAKPDGRNAAYLAYCHNRAGGNRVAAELYRVAAGAEGYERAWVFNNWAYSLCQFDQGPDQYRVAVEKATRALELSPALRPALYNRAVARFFLTRDTATQTVSDPRCLADIEAVLTGGEVTAELHYHAAVILTASAANDAAKFDRAAGHLEQAVALGRPARALTSDPVLKAHLAQHPKYIALSAAAPPATRPAPAANSLLMSPTPE